MPTRCDSATQSIPIIALTRPAGGNTGLAAAIRAIRPAVQILDWPLLDFEPTPDPAAARAALSRIAVDDWLIFVSPRAVQFAHALRDLTSLPACHWAAVGTATATAIRSLSPALAAIHVPTTTQDSEGLLVELPLATLAGRHVWIFRGETGREMLADTLRAQGAIVHTVAVYRRICAALPWSNAVLPTLWVITAPDSLGCLRHLADRIPAAYLRAGLLHSGLVVINERAEARARELGFTGTIIRAGAPDDSALARACVDHSLVR